MNWCFITQAYEDILHAGKFEPQQCWSLTCAFVKRIFTELGHVRVTARDGINVNDPWGTAATFLFATLKAHVVMQDFMRHSIKDHPSISSEMLKFVCYSQPANSATELLTCLAGVEALQRSDQSNISKMDTKLSQYSCRNFLWQPWTDSNS